MTGVSSWTASLRFEKQYTGSNVNSWGDHLDTVLDRVDTAIAGLNEITLTGDYTLTTSNTASDDARAAILKFSGSPAANCTITLPPISKPYRIWNNCGKTLTFTMGSGATVQVAATDIVDIFCTGSAVQTLGYGGASLKDYIASVVVGGGSSVASVVGNAGKWLTNNGAITSWGNPATTDLSDITAYTAARTAFAVAMAVAFGR